MAGKNSTDVGRSPRDPTTRKSVVQEEEEEEEEEKLQCNVSHERQHDSERLPVFFFCQVARNKWTTA